MKEIQKNPREPIRREPILGPGAGPLIGELVIMAGGFVLLILAVLAALYFKGLVYNLLFGESPSGIHSSAAPGGLKPGETTTIDGYTIKRID